MADPLVAFVPAGGAPSGHRLAGAWLSVCPMGQAPGRGRNVRGCWGRIVAVLARCAASADPARLAAGGIASRAAVAGAPARGYMFGQLWARCVPVDGVVGVDG